LILATFVGCALRGVLGGALATLAVFLPPILIIICLSPWYYQVKEARLMRRLIRGILAALVGFLALVTAQMGLAAISGGKELALLTGAAVALMVFRVSLFWVIAVAAALSLAIF
jgi:chromate transporter